MDLTTQNVIAWHDRDAAEHAALVVEWKQKGFLTLSLSVYGTSQDPRFAAVMVNRPGAAPETSFGPVDLPGMQAGLLEMAKKGLGPDILSATGPVGSAVFASVFTAKSPLPVTGLDLTGAQFTDLSNSQLAAGNILVWADAWGTPADTRYTAIWGPNPSRQASNVEVIDEALGTVQARFDALVATGCRHAHLAVTPSGGVLEQFVDSTIGAWSSRAGMTSAEYQTEFDASAAKGRLPLRVSASGAGSDARFAAIFAGRDNADERVFRSSGPVTVAGIDAVMEQYVKDQDQRGVALAITFGTRLIYAKSYTYAEPAPIYHDVLPVTPFRQASVTKMFAAVAMYRVMELQPSITLDTKMQSILNLKQPDGTAPKDGRFEDITLRHLLESDSGLDQGLLYGGADAVKAFGSPLPATPDQLARHGASVELTGTPGSPTNVVYGNYDYFMISQVVAKLLGATSFEAALDTLVLAPLHMTRTRESRSLVTMQGSDEARYHLRTFSPANGLLPLSVGSSVKSDGAPTVAGQYGTWDSELDDGAGGLSSAVVDVARLVAMFSARGSNPVLSSDSIDKLFANCAKASSTLSGPDAHGYHGFDGASAVDAAKHVYAATKGGYLPATATAVLLTTGGFGFVFAQNGNGRPAGTKPDWYTPVAAATKAHAWPETDLFPDFGMPTLTGGSIQPIATSAGTTQTVAQFQALARVQASIAEDFARRRRPLPIARRPAPIVRRPVPIAPSPVRPVRRPSSNPPK